VSYGTDTKHSSICQYFSVIPKATFFFQKPSNIFGDKKKNRQASIRPRWSMGHRVVTIFKQVPLREELWVSGS